MYQLNQWYNWLNGFATSTNSLAGFRRREQGTARRRRRLLAGDDACAYFSRHYAMLSARIYTEPAGLVESRSC